MNSGKNIRTNSALPASRLRMRNNAAARITQPMKIFNIFSGSLFKMFNLYILLEDICPYKYLFIEFLFIRLSSRIN